jgi:hypothetical protein
MSPSPKSHVARRRHLLPAGGAGGQLMRVALVAPLGALLAAVVALTFYCTSLLGEAAQGRAVSIGELPLMLLAGGFLVASALTVVAQSLRVANRVAGPEFRLCQALQRIRSGDVAFRVHLRRGDLLTDMAYECNELLDWLNANPPRGVRMGSDVVRVDGGLEIGAESLEEVLR